MPDDLTARVEAILRASAHEDHAGYWEVRIPDAARAIAALIAEAREAGRREGLEEAADRCEVLRSNANHAKKHAEMDAHTAEIRFQEGRWHGAYEIEEWAKERAAAIRALATEPRDAE